MKGLLIKDFRLLAGQKQGYAMIAAMLLIFLVAGQGITFAFSYLSIAISIFCVSTISYDEFEKGEEYLFTLPVTRKQYALEKYIFGIGLSYFGILLMAVCSMPILSIRHSEMTFVDLGQTVLGVLGATTILLAISIPARLKYGPETNRIAILLVTVIAVAIGYGAVQIAKQRHVDVGMVIDRFLEQYSGILGVFAVLFMLVILGASILLSMRIMEKKEF